METIEYKHLDRSNWPAGPWMDEPDKVQWPDPATGLPCLAVRHSGSGHWCGYVGVTKGHPTFGRSAHDEPTCSLSMHGGVTFNAFCAEADKETGICHIPGPGEPDKVWWHGFDCAHHMDKAFFIKKTGLGYDSIFDGVYRDLAFVRAECADLAAQLKAME